MTTYEPGTVAMVTYKSERCRAMLGAEGWWAITWKTMWRTVDGPEISDITPLVCIEATREDADFLEKRIGPNPITDAIRGQIPKPEPEKRWTVHLYDGGVLGRASAYLFDRGKQVAALYDSGASHAQTIADALNAAEPTP